MTLALYCTVCELFDVE